MGADEEREQGHDHGVPLRRGGAEAPDDRDRGVDGSWKLGILRQSPRPLSATGVDKAGIIMSKREVASCPAAGQQRKRRSDVAGIEESEYMECGSEALLQPRDEGSRKSSMVQCSGCGFV